MAKEKIVTPEGTFNINASASLNENREEDTIDLLDLGKYLLHFWLLILIGIVIGAAALGAYTMAKPLTYTSGSTIFIQSETVSITSLTDIQVGKAVSDGFVELCTAKPVIDETISALKEKNINLTRKSLLEKVSVKQDAQDSRIVKIYITTTDAEKSCTIAKAFTEAIINQVPDFMKIDPPTVVERPEPEAANARGTMKKAIMGGLLGAVAIGGVLVVMYLVNDQITTVSDAEKYLKTSVIAVIPKDRASKFRKKSAK